MNKKYKVMFRMVSILLCLSILLPDVLGVLPPLDIKAATNTYFVKVSGSGNKSGSDWNNALDANGFALQLKNATGGETFYLAEGTYTPKYSYTGKYATSDKYASFYLDVSVSIYGGYSKNLTGNTLPTDPLQRKNETILSGKISSTVNSLHVVSVYGYDCNGPMSIPWTQKVELFLCSS